MTCFVAYFLRDAEAKDSQLGDSRREQRETRTTKSTRIGWLIDILSGWRCVTHACEPSELLSSMQDARCGASNAGSDCI